MASDKAWRLADSFGAFADLKQSQIDELQERVEAYGSAEWDAALERAAMLHEIVLPECDRDRVRDEDRQCGCGAMGALIEFRDRIRALKRGGAPQPEPFKERHTIKHDGSHAVGCDGCAQQAEQPDHEFEQGSGWACIRVLGYHEETDEYEFCGKPRAAHSRGEKPAIDISICRAIGRGGYVCQLKTGHLIEHSDGRGHEWRG